ncbi:MAG: flagellar basal-body rod protein FlgF [Vicinamibacterales bacterium]|nr:flagellar basal-body rod protein FlgF [Vicinamibacterales bacterium]
MSSGAYVALSGMQARLDQLDRLAADLANANTTGYKGERSTTTAVERPFAQALDAAMDVKDGDRRLDFSNGTTSPTGRDFDFAIEGPGFFVVETAGGPRYTRNGHFDRSAEGLLVSAEGHPVLGEDGPIEVPTTGGLEVDADGSIRAGGEMLGKLQIMEFDDLTALRREGGSLFAAPGKTPTQVEEPLVYGRVLEGSNVNVADRMARLVELQRNFEALQRGLSVTMNDLNSRAIAELGRLRM